MEGKRIVVAVDESEESMYALSWCLHNLLSTNNNNNNNNIPISSLFLLYVKPPPPAYSSLDATGYLFGGDVIGSMEKYRKDAVKSVMDRAETIWRNFQIQTHYVDEFKMEKKVGSGDAKNVICVAVDKLKADVLVIGSHDYGFFKRAILGSVSEYCANHVKCPMVVVKRPKGNNIL